MEITYNSGMAIWDKEYLATLCILFDRIYLPALSEKVGMCCFIKRETESFHLLDIDDERPLHTESGHVKTPSQIITEWEDKYDLLINDYQILQRLSPSNGIGLENYRGRKFSPSLIDGITKYTTQLSSKRIPAIAKPSIFVFTDLLIHLIRRDLERIPAFYINNKETSYAKLYEKHRWLLLSYKMPKLPSNLPLKIVIDARNHTSDIRRNLSDNLESLSNEVKFRLNNDERISRIHEFVKKFTGNVLTNNFLDFKNRLDEIDGTYSNETILIESSFNFSPHTRQGLMMGIKEREMESENVWREIYSIKKVIKNNYLLNDRQPFNLIG